MSTEEQKPQKKVFSIVNKIMPTIMIVAVLVWLINMMRTDNQKVDFMQKYNQKADSLFQMQKHYEELLSESNLKIQSLTDQRTIIEKEKPKIYNNYVTKYITNSPDRDSSAFNQVYEQSVAKFDSLWSAGFFVTK